MKKFVLFLGFILVGTLSTLNSYAECDIFENEKITSESDNNLYLKDSDSGTFTMHETTRLKEKYSSFLQCGKGTILSSDKRSCQDNTIIFVTEKTSRGSFRLGYAEDFTEGPYVIKCSTGFNDSWEKVGGIDSLPECGNSAPQDTITVDGKTIHCKRKENRNGHEYCIGTKSGDICIESGNGKPADKPKEAEQKKEAKTEPIEENNEPKETCDTNQGYEYNPISKKCERTEAGKAEEKKEEPKKAPAKKKAAPKAKQPAPAKSTKKTPQEEFAEGCKKLPDELKGDNQDVTFTSELSTDGKVCTIKSNGTSNYTTLMNSLQKIIKESQEDNANCEKLKYPKSKTYSITCTEDNFTSTLSFVNEQITCEETQIFNDDTGECDTKAAEAPAEEAAPTQAPEENTAAAAAPAKTQEMNDESAASGNAASTAETTNGALDKLITEFKKEADGIVDIFRTRAPQVYEYQQQREKYGTDTSEINECEKNCETKTCRLNTSNNWECLKLNTDEWATEADCKKSCTGKDKICKMDKDNDQKMWKFKCKNLPALNSNQYTEREECTTKCKGKCVYKTHKERGHIFECPQDN